MRLNMRQMIVVFATFCALGLSAAGAHAALILSVAQTNNTTFTLSGDASSRQGLSQISTLNAGGSIADVVGPTVVAATRYASLVAADNGSNSALDSAAGAPNRYTTTFTVTATAGTQFQINIASALRGALTVVDDYALGDGTNGTASISNVTGTLNTVANPGLTLLSAASRTGSSGTNDVPFNQSNNFTLGPIFATGLPQSFAVEIQFNSSATSNQTTSVFDSGDEAAVRLGLAGTLSGISADDYPGAGSRVLADDGHFLTATVQYVVVPEPSSMVLGLLGAVGVATLARRRRYNG